MTINILERFINAHNYDIRVSRNGRWIDQKCTMDELCFVADCIVEYLNSGGQQPFQSPDIWHTEYAMANVQSLFCKPDPTLRTTLDEYNKFFRQPMKMLSAAGVLQENGKVNNTIQFSVTNQPILEFLSLRERNCMEFLCLYIEKTLRDSGLWDYFESFFDEQTEERFDEVKDAFINFCIRYTPINTDVEARRIFTKVLNPLAVKYRKKGTIKGHISKNIITIDEIKYNRVNWRDVGKDKNVSRTDAATLERAEEVYEYNVEKAKRRLRVFNDKYNSGRSEVTDRLSIGEVATHMHHIFPKHQFPIIADYIENLIALTSGQHLQEAHPAGRTQRIDTAFQYACLINKTDSIRKNLLENFGEPLYSFEDYMFVLDTGLSTDYFKNLGENDFPAVLTGIDMNYPSQL